MCNFNAIWSLEEWVSFRWSLGRFWLAFLIEKLEQTLKRLCILNVVWGLGFLNLVI
jgi:hypothetical protein